MSSVDKQLVLNHWMMGFRLALQRNLSDVDGIDEPTLRQIEPESLQRLVAKEAV